MRKQAGKRSLFLTLDLPATPEEACNDLRKQPDLSESQTAEERATEPGEQSGNFLHHSAQEGRAGALHSQVPLKVPGLTRNQPTGFSFLSSPL